MSLKPMQSMVRDGGGEPFLPITVQEFGCKNLVICLAAL